MDHVRSKTRSLGQIVEKPCVCSRDSIFGLILMKLGQTVCHDEILYMFENGSFQVNCRFNAIPHNPEGSGERFQGHYDPLVFLAVVVFNLGCYTLSVAGIFLSNGLADYHGNATLITKDNCENQIRKLGAVTGLTQGRYAGPCSCCLTSQGDPIFQLRDQIGILSTQYDIDKDGIFVLQDFARPGDSGALVTIREGESNNAVGIFTALRTDGMYTASPIKPVCDRLRRDGWTICTRNNRNNNIEPMDIDSD